MKVDYVGIAAWSAITFVVASVLGGVVTVIWSAVAGYWGNWHQFLVVAVLLAVYGFARNAQEELQYVETQKARTEAYEQGSSQASAYPEISATILRRPIVPSHIIKPDSDLDYYIEWSSIVDAPTFAGTRAQMTIYGLRNGWERVGEKLDRADTTSSSALWYVTSWDEDEEFIFEQTGWIPRSRMSEAIPIYFAANCDIASVAHLLKPLNDDPQSQDMREDIEKPPTG